MKQYFKKALIQSGLELGHIMASSGLIPSCYKPGPYNLGAIITLHRVEPEILPPFFPMAHLSITPGFLDQSIQTLRDMNYQFIALKDLPNHLVNPDQSRPVIMFTFDDGYRNNLEYGLPIFKKYNVPFTIFACSGFIRRTHTIWWETSKQLVQKANQLEFDLGCGKRNLETNTYSQKCAAFYQMAEDMVLVEQSSSIDILDNLALQYGVNARQIVDQLMMDEQQLKQLSDEPLADIGAHTVSHPNLPLLSDEQLAYELEQSCDDIMGMIGKKPDSFAYPYGKITNVGMREHRAVEKLGIDLAVTTQADILSNRSIDNLYQLKRISLNGHYQKTRYLKALVSGLVFKFARPGFV